MNNNINTEAIKEDLKNNIDIYIKNIKEVDDEQCEKLAKKARKKITNCEQKLEVANVEFEYFDFENINNTQKNESTENTIDIRSENKNEVKTLLSAISKKKISKSTIGVKVRLTNLEKLDVLTAEYNRSTNNIVSILFEGLYDAENKSLKYEIEDKEPTEAKSTSYILKTEIVEALDNLAKEKGYSRTELFNKILKDVTSREIETLKNK